MKMILLLMGAALFLNGCRAEMHNQPKRGAYKESPFFANRSAARPLPQGVIARGHLHTNVFFKGLSGTNLVSEIPIPVTRDVLERGRERFEIYCAVCHGIGGEGDGMIVQRGFPHPPSFGEDRLRAAPVGHFYRVMTDGYGVMFSYASRVAPEDRWAIAAYIRALQLHAGMNVAELPESVRRKLEAKAR